MQTTSSLDLFQTVMQGFGVDDETLTDAQKLSLERKGYSVFYDVLGAQQLELLRKRLDQLYCDEGLNAGSEITQEVGCRRLTNLLNKDELFDQFVSNRHVLAAVKHILRAPFKTNSLNFREPKGGYGLQRLHSDHEGAVPAGEYIKVNALWLIDEHTSSNGGARLVPGSHLSGEHPREAMRNHYDKHPHEVILVEPAGTVVVVNAHVWHGGTRNLIGAPRRTLHMSFIRRDHPQQLNERQHIKQHTLRRLSAEMRYLLDL